MGVVYTSGTETKNSNTISMAVKVAKDIGVMVDESCKPMEHVTAITKKGEWSFVATKPHTH